jgi:hypothetical protein
VTHWRHTRPERARGGGLCAAARALQIDRRRDGAAVDDTGAIMRGEPARRQAEKYVQRLQMLRRTVDVEIERTCEALRILTILEDAFARGRELSRRRRRRPMRAYDGLIPAPA